MAIVKQLDKRSGITYVYESTSYWDKEKQQPRSKRKVPSIVLRKFNSGYNRLAASDLDGRLASRLQCTCLGLDARRTVRYRPAGGFGPLFLEKQVTRL